MLQHLAGSVGILFTNRPAEEIIDHFEAYTQTDFARAGAVAARSFTIPAGVIYSRAGEIPEEDDVPLAHSLETTVRALGAPTRLDRGRVTLDQEYEVCKEGEELNSQQSRLLKLFGIATADFKIRLIA
jgi:mRNA turnover protein 4